MKTEDIEKQIQKLRRQQQEIERQDFELNVLPILRSYVGSTFAFRNSSYSCPEPHQKWDVFRKCVDVVRKSDYAMLVFEQVHMDWEGRPQASVEALVVRDASSLSKGSWQPCPQDEFARNREAVYQALGSPDKYIAHLNEE